MMKMVKTAVCTNAIGRKAALPLLIISMLMPGCQQGHFSQDLARPLCLTAFKKYRTDNPVLILGKFYPIGWSKNDRFAYLSEPADEAGEGYLVHFVIQDMHRQDSLWSYTYRSWDRANQYEGAPGNLAEVWQQEDSLFRAQLMYWEIEPEPSLKLKPLPIPIKNGTISFRLEPEIVGKDESPLGYAYYPSYRLLASSDQKNPIELFQKTYPKNRPLATENPSGRLLGEPPDRH